MSTETLTRRGFLGTTLAGIAAGRLKAAPVPVEPTIDNHTVDRLVAFHLAHPGVYSHIGDAYKSTITNQDDNVDLSKNWHLTHVLKQAGIPLQTVHFAKGDCASTEHCRPNHEPPVHYTRTYAKGKTNDGYIIRLESLQLSHNKRPNSYRDIIRVEPRRDTEGKRTSAERIDIFELYDPPSPGYFHHRTRFTITPENLLIKETFGAYENARVADIKWIPQKKETIPGRKLREYIYDLEKEAFHFGKGR